MKVEQIYTGCLAHAAYYIESNGEIDPANYYLIAHTPPLDPTVIVLDTITTTSITIHWNDISNIETGYKI